MTTAIQQPSISSLRGCAQGHLTHYTAPYSPRAFRAYDRTGDPNKLEPIDVLAPALLDAPLRSGVVVPMLHPTGLYRDLFERMEDLIADRPARSASFLTQNLAASAGPWWLFRRVLQASNSTRQVKASKVSKILHRKRPDLVPIFDSKVASFYGLSRTNPTALWPLFQIDLNQNAGWLKSLASKVMTSDGRPLSLLRAADIIIWEHMVGCPSPPPPSPSGS